MLSDLPALKIAVFISGTGSNFAAIVDNINSGYLDRVEILSVYTDNPKAGGLTHAKKHNIKWHLINTEDKRFTIPQEEEQRIALKLTQDGVDLVCLAGFMRIIKHQILNTFANRILNIHPSLLPKHPGLNVQQKAIDAGDEESGCTVHLVDQGIDTGAIIDQAKVKVAPNDTAESLSKRILNEEHILYSKVLKAISEGKIPLQKKP